MAETRKSPFKANPEHKDWMIAQAAKKKIQKKSIKNRIESIRKILDRKAVMLGIVKEKDDIKPSLQLAKVRIPVNIFYCSPGDSFTLSVIDRLQGCVDRVKTARLHLNEGEKIMVSHDEIDFSIFYAEIFTYKLITLALQVVTSELLTHASECFGINFDHGAKKLLTDFESIILCEPR